MADPLSVAASVAGLIGLGIQVVEQYMKWYGSFQSMDRDVSRMLKKLESLLQMLRTLEEILSCRKFRLDEVELLKKVESAVNDCQESISSLIQDLKKSIEHTDNGSRSKMSALGKRILYPFRVSTLQRLDEEVSDIRSNIALALDLLQLKDLKSMQYDHDVQKALLDRIRGDQVSGAVRSWLNAPDAAANHNIACHKRHANTGLWFVNGDHFRDWLCGNISLLWLKGFAGCGKSILCSTAIQHSLQHAAADDRIGVCFFYFSFNDETKQDASALLRALLTQLSAQTLDGINILNQLHSRFKAGSPPNDVLIEYFEILADQFRRVLVLIDALDESPRGSTRTEVLLAITQMCSMPKSCIQILVTSRHATDIQEYLRRNSAHEIELENQGIYRDIEAFVTDHLKNNPLLQKFHQHHDVIQRTITSRANGVFRWAECQLKSIERCPSSLARLEKCITSLPLTLDETYERILCSIDDDSVEDALRMLKLLCFSPRPLMTEEVIEGIAVDLTIGDLDVRRRYTNDDDIHDLCPGLLEIYYADIPEDMATFTKRKVAKFVRIAHFSVQEYLESDRIKTSKAARFHLGRGRVQYELCWVYLSYLRGQELSTGPLDPDIVNRFPLAPLAARYWPLSYRESDFKADIQDTLYFGLFARTQEQFENWPKLYDVSNPWKREDHVRDDMRMYGCPLYYACYLGITSMVERMITLDRWNGGNVLRTIDYRGGYCGSPLGAASNCGNLDIVNLLIAHGAEVNPQSSNGKMFTTPLLEACKQGRLLVAKRLLDVGADINMVCMYGTALSYAALGGHQDIVRLAISAGAEVNTQGDFETPLMGAVACGHLEITRILLSAGARVYCFRSADDYDSLICALDLTDNEDMRVLLQDRGRSLSPMERDNALVYAVMKGEQEWAAQLIQRGADVNHCEIGSKTAIQQASAYGQENLVAMLIANGADVNKTETGETALTSAVLGACFGITKMLLQAGANVEQRTKSGMTPLQQAMKVGHEDIARILLENGAKTTQEMVL